MAQTFFPITPVRVTTLGISYNWANVDITAYVPADARLAILYIDGGYTGAVRNWGVRGWGPPPGIWDSFGAGNMHAWAMVGIDPAWNPGVGIGFPFYNVALSNHVQAWLIGYAIETGGVFHLATDISAAIGDDAWTTVDLGPAGLNVIPVGTLGVIVQAYSNHAADRDWGLRMNGSGDNRTINLGGFMTQHSFAVGVDANLRVECYRDNAAVHHWLTGYIIEGAAFYQNAVEVTPAGIGVWNPLVPNLPATGGMGFIEVVCAGGQRYTAGQAGVAPISRYLSSATHNSAFVPRSEWNGQKENAGAQFFLTGYAEAFFAPTVRTDPATEIT